MRRILITGANGLLGQQLVRTFKPQHEVIATGNEEKFVLRNGDYHYEQLDITDADRCKTILSEQNPDIIVNAASFTDVDGCEVEKELCWNVNVKGMENLARAARRDMTLLVHISTDYIFDGENGPYSEEDRPNPLGYYGKAKLASENACRVAGVPFAIIRTSVLYGLGIQVKPNFFLWLYNSLKQGKTVNIVTDQYNTPTLVDDLATGIKRLVEKSAYGLYHLSGSEYVSRYEFALTLAEVFGFDRALIRPIGTDQLRQKAQRPMKGGLRIDKAVDALDYHPRTIEEAFRYLKSKLEDGLP